MGSVSLTRGEKKPKTYSISKCNYHIPAFDSHFSPNKHNKFYVRRASYLERTESSGRRRSSITEPPPKVLPSIPDSKPPLCRCVCEVLIIVSLLLFVPFILLVIELCW